MSKLRNIRGGLQAWLSSWPIL